MIVDSPGSVEATSHGPQLLHIEHGASKNLLVILIIASIISAAAVIGLMVATIAFNRMGAHVNVLQYDLAQMKAQLESQGLYEPTGH